MSNIESKKVKKSQISIVRLILVILAFIVIGRSIFAFVARNARTELVKYGNIENCEIVTGFIVKNETLINSPAPGQLKTLVEEGTKVKKGINIATITKDQTVEQTAEKIRLLDDEIAQLKNTSQNNTLFQSDLIKVQSQIDDNIKQLRTVAISGNIERLSQLKSSINDLMDKRLSVSGDQGFAASNIQSKIKEKENYITYMNTSKIDISSSTPGILSFKIDGFEQLLNPKALNSITLKDIEKLSNATSEVETPKSVQAGLPLCKIIDNFQWQVLCTIKNSKLEPLKVGDIIKISINEDIPVASKVESIRDVGQDTSIIVLSLSSNLEQYYAERKVNIKLIKQNFEGIKVPTTSLIVKEGKRGVMLVEKGITKFKEVDVKGFDKKNAIIEVDNQLDDKKGLSLYSEIVINPSFVEEGIIIK